MSQQVKKMKKRRKRIAEVTVGVPVPGPFHYRVPSRLADDLEVGKRVWVPFRNRLKVGYVVGFVKKPKVPKLRSIRKLIDPTPILSRELLELTRWVAGYYRSSWGEAIESAIPGAFKRGKTRMRRRRPSPEGGGRSEGAMEPQVGPGQTQVGPGRTLEPILKALDSSRFEVFLLHELESSRRLNLYLRSCQHILSLGRSCILLVPEISLIPPIFERFKSSFGEAVCTFHSGLSEGERLRQWYRMRDGIVKVVVGARSAVFSPVKDLGLIIVDEEHEAAYKQEEAPKYNARDVAIVRARHNEACVILGSPTPSLESYYEAKKKRYKLIKLNEMPEERTLPRVQIVDMKEELKEKRRARIFSRVLEWTIKDRLARKEKVILFLNRRGFSTFISCKGCGFVLRCKACGASLTYHFYRKELVCHYCNYHQDLSEICPECKSRYLSHFGIGTQKVESEVCRLFPEANVARMDTDTANRKKAYQRILSDARSGRLDVLVGTQLVARTAEPIHAGLVGVISADFLLNLPDFRSSERTIQLFAQLAGGLGTKGEMIIQTYSPTHHSIRAAQAHDFEGFFKEEIRSRRELGYPPYFHLINLILRGKKKEKVISAAKALAKSLKKKKPKGITLVGPAPLSIPKLRGSFRWHLMLKAKEVSLMNEHLRKVLESFKGLGGVRLTVDVDPITML